MSLVQAVARVRTAMTERDPGFASGSSLVGRSWRSPFAAAQPTHRGRTIRELAAHEGRVYVGYGDHRASDGPIHVHSIDLRTGELSGSELVIAGAQNTHMRVIDGALYIAGVARRHRGWDGVQPFGSNHGGVWAMSGTADCRRVMDLEAVPGLPGAVMAAGFGVDAATGAPSYATWLTVDGGLTWSSFRDVVALARSDADSGVRLIRVGAELYAITRGGAWRWRKVLPQRPENVWSAGWECIRLPDHCQVMSMETVHRGGNSTFAAWSKGPMWTYDGHVIRRMFGHLDFAMAFCTDSDDGFVYAVTRGAGVVRSHDGARWFRHPSAAVWGATGIPAFSIAVADGTIFVGDDTSRIHAVATTSVSWAKAETA